MVEKSRRSPPDVKKRLKYRGKSVSTGGSDDLPKSLEESHDKYLELYDLAPCGYFTLDIASNIVNEANLTGCNLLAIERHSLIRDNFGRYLEPGTADEFFRCRKRATETPSIESCEVKILRNDGTTFWALLEVLSRPAENEIRVTMTDISGQKELERALKEKEEYARKRAHEIENLMELVPAAVWIAYDPECRFITGNARANRFYEARDGDNVSAGTTDGSWHDTARRFFKDGRELTAEELPMQVAARDGTFISDYEMEVITPSGRRLTILGDARPLFDEQGDVRGAIASFIDITDRRYIEAELERYRKDLERLVEKRTAQLTRQLRRLKQAEGNLDLLVESTPDGILVIDRGGNIMFANSAAKRLFGYHDKELVGTIFGYPVLGEKVELTVPDVHGNTRYVEMRVVDITWRRKKCSMAILEDITEHKKSERRIRSLSRRLLKAQEKERRKLSHALHDEVGGTITVLKLAVHHLRTKSGKVNTDGLADLDELVDELTDEIRHLSHDIRPSMLDDFGIKDALEWYFERHGQRTNIGVSFSCNLSGERFPEELETAVYRIVQEALNNAVKYSKSKRIEVELLRRADLLYLTVTDYGCGFDPANIKSGMGITGMQDLADLVGGKLFIDSVPGHGTRIVCDFPIEAEEG